jgi:hypothetical protein
MRTEHADNTAQRRHQPAWLAEQAGDNASGEGTEAQRATKTTTDNSFGWQWDSADTNEIYQCRTDSRVLPLFSSILQLARQIVVVFLPDGQVWTFNLGQSSAVVLKCIC